MLLVGAVCVGGTFMVVTMAGLQEARRVAGESATRLMAAMTAAFAVGQLAGPLLVVGLAGRPQALTVAGGVASLFLFASAGVLAATPLLRSLLCHEAGATTAPRDCAVSLIQEISHMAAWQDRMPPLARDAMDDAQRVAADELIAGPRKGVKGPFVPMLRSPSLMQHLQKAGEYLRFDSALPRRVSEFATLIVARDWRQQFEWFVHAQLAQKEGTSAATIEALRCGRRPPAMSDEEAFAYDFVTELNANRGVDDATYREAVDRFGERGVIDLVGLVGYFTLVSMILNVAHTPAGETPGAPLLPAFPR